MIPIFAILDEFPVRIMTMRQQRSFMVVFDDAFIIFVLFVLNPLSGAIAITVSRLTTDIRRSSPLYMYVLNIFMNLMTIPALMLIAHAPIEHLNAHSSFHLLLACLMVIPLEAFALIWVTEPSLSAFRKNAAMFVNPARLSVLAFGIALGVPAGVLFHLQPWVLPFLAVVFVLMLWIQMSFQNAREERDRLQELMDIFLSVRDEVSFEEVRDRLVDIAGRTTVWQDLDIRSNSPGENETGVVIQCVGQDDLWLVAPRGKSSPWRYARDIKYLETVASIGARAFEHVHVQEQLRDAARKDALTGLVNRRTLTNIVEHDLAAMRRNNGTITVFFIDVDKFKPINDTYGHAAGDLLLQMLAVRLLSMVREQDVVARLGGDEFVISCRDITTAGAADLAQRLLLCIEEPFEINTEDTEATLLSVSASIGIATAPYVASTLDELIGAADAQMYIAKQSQDGNRISYAVGG